MPAQESIADLIEAKPAPPPITTTHPSAPPTTTADTPTTFSTAPPPYPHDAITAASDYPTPGDLASLPRVPAPIPWKVFTIAFVELVERMSYYGTLVVYNNFIQDENPGTRTGRPVDPGAADAQPGALGLGQRTAVGVVRFNQFWVRICTFFLSSLFSP